MDLKTLSLGERIVAVSGAVLLILTFLPWFEGGTAWELFGIVDVLLAILALAAVIFPLARAAGFEPGLRPTNRAILIRVGAVALILILAYFLEAVGRAQIGLWLAVIAAGALFYGASQMPDEEAASRRRDRPRPLRAHENFGEPPPGMGSWREQGFSEDPAAYERAPSREEPDDGAWRDAESTDRGVSLDKDERDRTEVRRGPSGRADAPPTREP